MISSAIFLNIYIRILRRSKDSICIHINNPGILYSFHRKESPKIVTHTQRFNSRMRQRNLHTNI